MRWAGHMAYNVSAGNLEGKRPLARPKLKLERNNKTDCEEMESEGVKWVNVVGCCEHFHKMQGISGLAEELLASEEGSGSMGSVSKIVCLFVCWLVTSVHIFYLFLMLSITKQVGLCSNISDFCWCDVLFETHPQC